jgi:hypothetical protein
VEKREEQYPEEFGARHSLLETVMTNPPLPQSLQPFAWAVIRLATYVAKGTSQSRLLFGYATLLAKDRPQPVSGSGVDHINVGSPRAGTVFFRRTALTASEAITWYRSASSGVLLTPVPSNSAEVSADLDGRAIAAGEFFDDPEWPALGVPTGPDQLFLRGGPDDPAPFVGSGSSPARIHRRFGDGRGFEPVVDDPNAIAFLKRRLHVDLSDYSEYLGGLALVLPDPILRRIDHFVVPSEDRKSERLVFRLVPRAGQNLSDISLTVIERRANLLSRFETISVPSDGLLTLPRGLPVDASGYVATHRLYGVLVHQPPLPFIRAVNVSFGVIGRRVRVDAPKSDSPQAANARYEIQEMAHEHPISVGDYKPRPALSRVIGAQFRRERRAEARRLDQTWFDDGTRDAALGFVRSRIGRAREEVLIADPYFGGRQNLQFLHAVARPDVAITILTSRLAFESNNADDVTPPATLSNLAEGNESGNATDHLQFRRLNEFSRSLETFNQRGIQNITALVLTGRNPPLHDRFLVVDHAVWFLGNSLNALGDRASLILEVPDVEPILERLDQMKSQAIPFSEYFERRKRAVAARSRRAKRS